jgi:hypothetical protein
MLDKSDPQESRGVERPTAVAIEPAKKSAESFRPEDAELVFGVAYAAGTYIEPIVEALKDYIRRFGYLPQEVRISEYIRKRLKIEVSNSSEADRIESLIKGGNQIC